MWPGWEDKVQLCSKANSVWTHLGHIGSAGEGDRVEGLGEASKLRFRRHAAVCEIGGL